MRDGSAGSGPQNAISVMRYASGMIDSAKPNAWNVSTLRAWMPSAWPIARRPWRRSMVRTLTWGNCASCAAVIMPAGPVPTISTSTSPGRCRPVQADPGCGLHARIGGHVPVVVELHACFLTPV